MTRIVLFVCLLCSLVGSAAAIEIENVQIPETLENGLRLNGAGIRSKFFFKIYIAELYLEHPEHLAHKVLESTQKKRMIMHFLYKEVSKEKLIDAWNEGFAANLSDDVLRRLTPQITHFNSLFVTVREGDEIVLDFVSEAGTTVTIAGVQKGVIKGAEFNRALLSIWLGEEPVTEELRAALLGSGES